MIKKKKRKKLNQHHPLYLGIIVIMKKNQKVAYSNKQKLNQFKLDQAFSETKLKNKNQIKTKVPYLEIINKQK